MMQSRTRSLVFGALLAAGMVASAGAAQANDLAGATRADDQSSTAPVVTMTPAPAVTATTPNTVIITSPGATLTSSTDYQNAARIRDARMKDCGKLMPSNREMCVLQAQAEFDHTITALREPDTQTVALQQIERDYADALASCGRVIDSAKDICRANAQADRSKKMNDLAATTTDRSVLAAAMQSYQEAVSECQRLPSSEREICIANAGTLRSLPSAG